MLKQTADLIAGFGENGTIIIMALALLQCLFGYKFMKSWTLLIGFLIGFIAAYNIALQFIPTPVLYPALIAFLAGVLVAAIAYLVYPVGVFLFAGFVVDLALLMIVPTPDTQLLELLIYIVAGVLFVIAGLLCARYRRPVVIVVTAIAGAIVAMNQIAKLGVGFNVSNYILLAITAGLCALGILVQFLTTMKEGKQEKAKKEKKEEKRRESARRRAKRRGDNVRFDTPSGDGYAGAAGSQTTSSGQAYPGPSDYPTQEGTAYTDYSSSDSPTDGSGN